MRKALLLVVAAVLSACPSAVAQVFSGAEIGLAGQSADLGVDPMINELAAGERLFGSREEYSQTGWRGELADTPPKSWTLGMWGSPMNAFTTVERLSDTEYLLEAEQRRGGVLVVLTGVDLSKVTDGVRFCLQHPVVINRTYDHSAFEGDKPTKLLVLDANFEAVLGKKADLTFREWTDVSGVFKVEAKFIQYVNKAVTLEKRDGSRVAVPLSKLSEADRKFALSEHEKATAEKDKK